MHVCAKIRRWHAKPRARLITVCTLFTVSDGYIVTLHLTRYYVSSVKQYMLGRATTCYSNIFLFQKYRCSLILEVNTNYRKFPIVIKLVPPNTDLMWMCLKWLFCTLVSRVLLSLDNVASKRISILNKLSLTIQHQEVVDRLLLLLLLYLHVMIYYDWQASFNGSQILEY